MHLYGFHIHRTPDPWTTAPPWAVELHAMMALILEKVTKMSAELDALTAQVKANSDLLDSATTLINGIAARITAAGTDPAALQALTDELKAKDTVLAAAVAQNTPAAP